MIRVVMLLVLKLYAKIRGGRDEFTSRIDWETLRISPQNKAQRKRND